MRQSWQGCTDSGDTEVVCEHVTEQQCHASFATRYSKEQCSTVKYSAVQCHTRYHPESQKKCEDEYQKDCRIEFSLVAENVTEEVCEDPLVVEDCGEDDISNSILDGDDEDYVCHIEYETVCVREKEQIEVNALNLFSEIQCSEVQVTDDKAECEEVEEEVCHEEPSNYSTARTCYTVPRQVTHRIM